jgi:sec-independent protein translocase protein TatB
MFDIGFSEIVVIGVVALVVIGPERLPKAARTLGHLFGRLQRYVNEVKSDINREMELDELRRLRQEVQGAATELQKSVQSAASEVESGVRSVEQQLNDAAHDAGSDTATAAASAPATDHGAAALPPLSEPSAVDASGEPVRQPSLPGFNKI